MVVEVLESCATCTLHPRHHGGGAVKDAMTASLNDAGRIGVRHAHHTAGDSDRSELRDGQIRSDRSCPAVGRRLKKSLPDFSYRSRGLTRHGRQRRAVPLVRALNGPAAGARRSNEKRISRSLRKPANRCTAALAKSRWRARTGQPCQWLDRNEALAMEGRVRRGHSRSALSRSRDMALYQRNEARRKITAGKPQQKVAKPQAGRGGETKEALQSPTQPALFS
jgi:hypothetical protein